MPTPLDEAPDLLEFALGKLIQGTVSWALSPTDRERDSSGIAPSMASPSCGPHRELTSAWCVRQANAKPKGGATSNRRSRQSERYRSASLLCPEKEDIQIDVADRVSAGNSRRSCKSYFMNTVATKSSVIRRMLEQTTRHSGLRPRVLRMTLAIQHCTSLTHTSMWAITSLTLSTCPPMSTAR